MSRIAKFFCARRGHKITLPDDPAGLARISLACACRQRVVMVAPVRQPQEHAA